MGTLVAAAGHVSAVSTAMNKLSCRSWGYFQRRMQLRRDADSSGEAAGHASTMKSTEWRDGPKPHSSYGETSAVWRCALVLA